MIAFQANAFQNDAFQMGAAPVVDTFPPIGGGFFAALDEQRAAQRVAEERRQIAELLASIVEEDAFDLIGVI